jgi:hypothetical protein
MSNLKSTIARVVIRGRPNGTPEAAEYFMLNALRKWPANAHTKFLITPGGFVKGKLPPSLSGKVSWDSSPKDMRALTVAAAPLVIDTVFPKVIEEAKGRVKIITVCVDLIDYNTGHHAELIAAFNVDTCKIVGWTGKSYPVPSQEKTLIQVKDLSSHTMKIGRDRVLILGCHDLNMWNPRGWANQSPGSNRRKRCAAMRKLAKEFKPTIVIQHPHDTDSPNIWTLGWSGIQKQFPKLKAWASGICYNNENGGPQRAPLKDVLTRTQGGPVFNMVAN